MTSAPDPSIIAADGEFRLSEHAILNPLPDGGFLLEHPSDGAAIKLGSTFSRILPLLRNGFSNGDITTALCNIGVPETDAVIHARRVVRQLARAGFLVTIDNILQPSRDRVQAIESVGLAAIAKSISRFIPKFRYYGPSLGLAAVAGYSAAIWYFLSWKADFALPSLPMFAGYAVVLMAFTVLWLFLHEFAHALTASFLGADIVSMGISVQVGRGLTIFPYCRLSPITLVAQPRKAAAIFLAGPVFDAILTGALLGFCYFFGMLEASLCKYAVAMSSTILLFNTSMYLKSDLRDAIKSMGISFGTDSLVVAVARTMAYCTNMALALAMLAFLTR